MQNWCIKLFFFGSHVGCLFATYYTSYSTARGLHHMWQKQKIVFQDWMEQLVDKDLSRHACMHWIVTSRLHFTLIYSHSAGRVGRHNSCCLLVILPISILLLGTLGWLSAPNGFRLLPGPLFLVPSLSLYLFLSLCGFHPLAIAHAHCKEIKLGH